MDSKQKYIKNRYWKKKYKQRNSSITANTEKSLEQKNNEPHIQYAKTDEFVQKQLIPKEDWLPEYDSSSSSDIENFKSCINIQKITLTSTCKSIDESKDYDNDWFNKDNIKFKTDIRVIDKNQEKLLLQKTIRNEFSNTISKINITEENKNFKLIDNEEAELEFLLSLKEPVFTGPVIVKHKIKNERRIDVKNSNESKPIKSIDLEKWLDSVLDD